MLNMTGIEEIVKYQQELLNHQRNQKLIQKETIKLLNALNKNITFMSNRLDDFAQRANIKIETSVPGVSELGNGVIPSTSNGDTYFSNSLIGNNFYDTQTINLMTGSPALATTNTVTPSNQSVQLAVGNEEIKEYYILSDCNLEPLCMPSGNIGNNVIQNGSFVLEQPQQVNLIPTETSIIDLSPKPASKSQTDNSTSTKNVKTPPNKLNNSRSRSTRLSDTTNLRNTNMTTTSDADTSLDDDMSLDESSEDEKETIQARKKPKTSLTPTQISQNSKSKESEESHNQQRLFNKYVRENVETRLGKEFLLLHEIQEIDQAVMESIKKDALEVYPPVNIRPRRAWHLAKASLRCRRRSLRRQKEKQILSNSSNDPQPHDNNPNEDSQAQTILTMTSLS